MFSPLFLALILAIVLAACGTAPIADKVIKDVVDPQPIPIMGDPISFQLGETVNLTNGADIIAVTFVRKDENGLYQWTCVSVSDQDCAERHGGDSDMLFYLDFGMIGKTTENSAAFAEEWEVVR